MEELREKIYKEQFFEYDYNQGCEKANDVLKSLENLKQNPILLDYVIKCLVSNEIEIKEYFYIIVHPEKHNRVFDVVIDKVFDTIEDAEDYTRNGHFSESLLFEKYSIKSINQKQYQ
jgi:hypothetical protein